MLYTYVRLLVVLMVLAAPAAALAQSGPQLHWNRYDNFVEILADGSVQVEERQELIVDRGPANGMTRTFETGNNGRITNIRVLENGQPLPRREGREPGTYSGSDNGSEASIRVNFSDPSADRHAITIQYTINRTLVAENNSAIFDWNFFWSSPNAPEIRSGSVVLNFPGPVSAAQLSLQTGGAPVRQSSTNNSVRWELAQSIQGRELAVQAAFPRTLLAQNAQFRSAGSASVPQPNTPGDPTFDPAPGAVVGLGIGGMVFCIFILVFFFIAFMIIRASARSRRVRHYPTAPPAYDHDPFGAPYSRRGRRRRYGGWGGGGWFFPPIFIPPPGQPHAPQDNNPSDNTPFGGGGSSGGGGTSWGDSGGGGSSWGDSGGGGSSWGSMGGGGSSWGGGGGSGGGGGGGSGGGSFD